MLIRLIICLFTIVIIFLCQPVFASSNDLGLWTPVYIRLPITKKIKTELEVSPRIEENFTHIHQLITRPSLGYQLNKNLSIWTAYAWTLHFVPRFVREQRLWQQVLYEKTFPKLEFTGRMRMEERFIQNVEGVSLRSRYLLRGIHPIGKRKVWGIVLSNELFVNLNSHFLGPQAGIDQNRFFICLNRKISKNVSMEGGYQLQYINEVRPQIDKLNHLILVNFYFNLPQLLKD